MKRIIIANPMKDIVSINDITDNSIVGAQLTTTKEKAFLCKNNGMNNAWGVIAKEGITRGNVYGLTGKTCKGVAERLIRHMDGGDWKLFLFENENELFKWMSED